MPPKHLPGLHADFRGMFSIEHWRIKNSMFWGRSFFFFFFFLALHLLGTVCIMAPGIHKCLLRTAEPMCWWWLWDCVWVYGGMALHSSRFCPNGGPLIQNQGDICRTAPIPHAVLNPSFRTTISNCSRVNINVSQKYILMASEPEACTKAVETKNLLI